MEGGSMIYTIRTFEVERKNYREFVRLSEEEIWPGFEGMDGRALGLWIVTMGGAERILLMTRYKSLAHWQETRNWGDQGNALRKAVAARAELIGDTDLIALRPLTRRQPEEDAKESEPGIYTMRTFRVEPGNINRFASLSEDGWWPWVDKVQNVRPLGLWLSIIAPEVRIYLMARYDDMAHWEATRGPGPEPTDPEMREFWEKARAAIMERTSITLDTNVRVLRPISRRRP
jgi:hypothetical protein